MPPILENTERRKRRDPQMRVWDRIVRIGHWLLAFAFATLYLQYKKFPLHPYAGYLVCAVVMFRIFWGFRGPGAARFSTFCFSPRAVFRYLGNALKGHAEYHFSHNPMGAAMVYALLALLLANCLLGMLAYSASQQLGPFGAHVPDSWEETLVPIHAWLGHATAVLVALHLAGVLWAARLHRENYILGMLSGVRRIPRAMPIPEGVTLVASTAGNGLRQRTAGWLARHPMLGSIVLMGAIVGITLPLIEALVRLNRILPAY